MSPPVRPGAPVTAAAETEPDLAECDYGTYEGVLSCDIREERPDSNTYRDGRPGGERPQQETARADRLIAWLCTLCGSRAVLP